MNGYLVRDVCPSCGASTARGAPEVRARRVAESLTFDEVAGYWRGFRADQCFFTYVRCGRCRLLYCPVYFTGEQLAELYASMPDNTAGAPEGVVSRTQRTYLERLRRRGMAAGAFLELGPDIGLFTRHAVATGLVRSAVLVEPNRDAHPGLLAATSNLADVRIVVALEDDESDNRFQNIVAVHVLDHLLKPSEELDLIASRAVPGSVLLAVVHDESSLLRQLMGRRWPPFCLQHPQLFNRRSLVALLTAHGFTGADVSKSTNWFPLQHVARTGATALGLPARLAGIVPAVQMPIRLGNLIVTAVRADDSGS